ncbi:MAG TPA: L-lysine 6-transaminase [Candidatus Mcinerneyibacteriales bacterium]|jgi:L-lysine 6-transaminase|nr:L-lysine 6-transaminase [Candidatus Mcinerneyibacteriales bacterium]HPE20110.1 L-lysine 6-transaminase [Candidatus Mcinerneyibacteriales bacterium]
MEKILPKDVHKIIGEHMLADGFDMVYDIRKSHGSYLYDAKHEREYLDFFSFFASQPLGHNHPKMTDPDFLDHIERVAISNPSNSDIYTPEMAAFTKAVASIAMPSYMKYQFFVSGGALAVENAMKTAFDWKVRKNFEKGYKEEKGLKIIHFEQAFHGRTGYTLTVTNTFDSRKTKYFPKFDWPRIPNPKMIFPLEEHLEEVKRSEEKALSMIMDLVRKDADDYAAILIEPIQGEGGDNHFRPEFMQALQKICRDNDILFILDEVQSGMGITGKMWAHEYYDIQPDIISFGKKMQVCGIFAGPRIDEVENNVFKEASRINSTWGGNLTDMVRATRYLEIIKEDRLVEHAAEMGEYIISELRQFEGTVTNIRGKGLMIAFDLENSEKRDAFKETLFEKGLIALPCGQKSIRFRPFLDVTKADIDKAISIIKECL